jgi:crotonobetainyl-CoA:carnitine CoA-transferase CaiB-like acyl-CoA transferase
MSRLLAGFRVVELSLLLNGATTGMMLADLGADVVKVESPFLGDYIRVPSTRHLHSQVNKNKRSLTLDLATAAGREIMHRLVAASDVFLTNLLPRATARLGVSYEQLQGVNPALVYCQVTGFGATGPLADVPTHGQMMDAMAGALPAEVGPDGLATARRPPAVRSGSLTVAGEGTATGAVYAALHVAAALARRASTGDGCYIDVAATDAVVASAWTTAVAQLNLPPAEWWWNAEDAGRDTARYQHYIAADGKFLMFCPEEKKFWEAFCDLVGRPDLKPRQAGYDLRRELQSIIGSQDRQYWLNLAVTHRLPIGPVNDGAAEVRADPHICARGLFVEASAEAGEPFVYVGPPAIVAGQPYATPTPAPSLGENTEEILTDLGYTAQDISALHRDQVIAAERRIDDYISEQIHAEDR